MYVAVFYSIILVIELNSSIFVKSEAGLLAMNDKELEFSVFCIESVAERLGCKEERVYELLTEKSSILKEYIIPNYEVLHTLGKEYIVDDIIAYMQQEGVVG